jgi:hypothetical protein
MPRRKRPVIAWWCGGVVDGSGGLRGRNAVIVFRSDRQATSNAE